MIGYYVHHDDLAPRRRFEAVSRHLDGQLTGLGCGPAPDGAAPWIELPADDPAAPLNDPTAGGLLHHAPLRHPTVRERMARLTAWLHDHDASLLVVDRCVEVALLARLLGVPTVLVAGRGHRDDRAHRLGYDAATAIIAPWQRTTHPTWPTRRTERTHFVGPVSHHDGRDREDGTLDPCGASADGSGCVTLVVGRGDHELGTARAVSAVVDATPGWCWHVVGQLDLPARPQLFTHGEVDDLWPLLCHSRVVIGPDDDGLLDDVAAARARFLALPPPRTNGGGPGEASCLADARVIAMAPRGARPRRWPQLLDQAAELDPTAWDDHHDGQGAARMARFLEAFAQGQPA